MKVWHFTEAAYFEGWNQDELTRRTLRVEPPSRMVDPVIASQLLNRYLDEWELADELGLNIMVNEHHSTLSCMTVSAILPIAMLARRTKKARLLFLGIPTTNRMDPMRIAEEVAYVDLVSGGRLEMGLIKGAAWELFSSNLNPVRHMERFWEAHDLIIKALTHLDGPFAWEGKYFNYRKVNVIPRCFQQPHPPVWIPGHSVSTARGAAKHGHVFATFMAGKMAKMLFDAYRETYRDTFGQDAPLDRLAYLAMTAVGNDERQVNRLVDDLMQYPPSIGQTSPQYVNPPGYASPADNARMLIKSGKANATFSLGAIQTIDGQPLAGDFDRAAYARAGVLFAGTPPQVVDQIKTFSEAVGGFGHLLSMGHGGPMNHENTAASMRLMAKEVMPRLP